MGEGEYKRYYTSPAMKIGTVKETEHTRPYLGLSRPYLLWKRSEDENTWLPILAIRNVAAWGDGVDAEP